MASASCSDDKNGREDADVEEEAETEGPEADTEDGEPLPCTAHAECSDNNPCNGNESCDLERGVCVDGTAVEDGSICDLDPRSVCIEGACAETACGDGIVDGGAGEFCEPPGLDGCDEDCRIPCASDPDCPDDGDACNGREFCDESAGFCARSGGMADGAVCSLEPRALCLGGLCTASICGDGFLDSGGGEFCEPPYEDGCDPDCGRPCAEDPDCADDGNMCNGSEYCSPDTLRCARRGSLPDGMLCALEPRSLCLAGTCSPSLCGDGWVDVGTGEYCEPPYVDACDGECGLPCEGDPDCLDDGSLCNGIEYCNMDTQRCSRRNPLPDGAVCGSDPRSICIGWSCTPSLCGDGFLDTGGGEFCEPPDAADCDGDCALPCGGDPDCIDDGNICNGEEYCNADTLRCSRRNPLPDGSECGDAPPRICLSGFCQPGTCGNGVVDTSMGEECDDGNMIAGDGCEPLTCLFSCHTETEAADCDDGLACTDDLCTDLHQCGNFLREAGTVCRPLASQCDAEETCSGTDSACPADGYAPSGSECNDADPLTIRDRCDGSGGCAGESLTEMSGVTAVSAGEAHACAVASGALYCWGENAWGQLGDGTTAGTSLPVPVSGMASGASDVSAGQVHTCALTDTGGIKCWGNNESGQMGIGTFSGLPNPDPVDVPGMTSGVFSLDAGYAHACAISAGGSLVCWGNNAAGQIGDGTIVDRPDPTDVTGLASSAQDVTAGKAHTCALLDTGSIQCWGDNSRGQLGDGSTTVSYVPVDVTGLASAALAVEAGENHTCALLDTGEVQCWGGNGFGQLGNGTTVDSSVPVSVSGIPSAAAGVGAGRRHSCAVLAAGDVYCWGLNEGGKLGNGLLDDSGLPAAVLDPASSVSTASCGGTITCAVLTTGRAQCWGYNGSGQLGKGEHYEIMVPRRVNTMASGGASVSAGSGQACAVMGSGNLLCWGSNSYGELGNGTFLFSSAPDAVTGLPTLMGSVSAGKRFTCAVSEAGSAHCWGANAFGQLGNGTYAGSQVPVDVSGLSSGVAVVSTGAHHACALLESGGVACWGQNTEGQLGDGTTTGSAVPVNVTLLDSAVLSLASGHYHACVALDTGAVQCWGYNASGQLGDGSTTNRSVPVDVTGLGSVAVAVAAGAGHTCALLDTGEARCWGENGSGQLGNGTPLDSPVPVSPSGLAADIAAITCGDFHTCALDMNGGLKCWGDNLGGGLGIGSNDSSNVPVDVVGLPAGVATVEAGGYHTCAVLDTGAVLCWGHDGGGEVSSRFSGYPHTVLVDAP